MVGLFIIEIIIMDFLASMTIIGFGMIKKGLKELKNIKILMIIFVKSINI